MSRALTAVFAHPDDETFATGATLARYASEGVRTSLYCATDGDAGQSSGILVSSSAELGRVRRSELRGAADVLGIGTIELGGYPDGLLAKADLDRVIGEIVHVIRQERPDVVLTFGPEGAPTQHTDHRTISRLATAAHLLAGTTSAYPHQLRGRVRAHRAARLCYVTWPAPGPDAFYQTQGQPIHIRIDARPWNSRKQAAFEMHASQHQHRENFERYALTDSECYFIATGTPAPQEVNDLFAGL